MTSSIREEAPARWLPWILLPLAIVAAFLFGRCAPVGSEHAGHAHGDAHEQAQAQAKTNAEIWTCSMHPQIQQGEPGQCPICGMDLIPLGDLADQQGDRVSLSARAQTLARIETVPVARMATPGIDLRLLGRVEVDESRVRNVSAWIGGRVDALNVRETGTVVRRGQTIASLYSPEVYAAHQDLLTAKRQVDKLAGAGELARSSAESALAAARERLSLLGLPEAEIDEMAGASKPRKSVAIHATYGGTVIERLVTQGQYLEAGAVLYRIADLSRLWVQLDAYEADLPTLIEGQSVDIEVEALPGERFSGSVAFIDPLVDPRRRVTRVRVEVDNRSGKLRPGMFVEAVVRGGSEAGDGERDDDDARQQPLMVPASAPLFTGKRSLVYVEVPDDPDGDQRPAYEPRTVELGPRMGEFYPVVAGLSPGEQVVVHGAFVIDADLQIRGGASMMSNAANANAGSDDGAQGPGARIQPDAALRSQLAALLQAYLDMQVALADDEWKQAQAAAARLAAAARAVEPAPGPAADAWAPLGPALARRGDEAAQSSAIEGARGAFLALSLDAKTLLQVFGNPLATPVRLAFCPMANADAGAEWIQAGDEIDNSYFGAAMLRCGEIRATVEPGQYLLGGDP